MNKIVLLLTLMLVASQASAESSLNALPVQGEDSSNIQEQIAAAQKEVLSRGAGFVLIGTIEKGSSTPYSINGEDFVIADDTLVQGKIRLGEGAEVSGIIRNGSKIAEVVTTASETIAHITPPEPEALQKR